VSEPLVSICIPTYQRAATLARALDSALAQTHPRLEVVISDNASGDGTAELCRAVAAADARVRYLRQERNLGPTANFNALFAACRGDYVLMLADDDWLDPGYVAACLAALRADPGAALIAGVARYWRDGHYAFPGVVHEHRQSDPAARVLAYLTAVDDNGVFYGLMPRAVLERASPARQGSARRQRCPCTAPSAAPALMSARSSRPSEAPAPAGRLAFPSS
jgi:glycosyltransferase involved in cell wall biosynthesis